MAGVSGGVPRDRLSVRFGYRCFDRILLNGLIQPFQQPDEERPEQGTQKPFQPAQEEAEVVAGGGQHRIDAVAVAPFEVIASHERKVVWSTCSGPLPIARSPPKPCGGKFARDSPLEGTGFEPSVLSRVEARIG